MPKQKSARAAAAIAECLRLLYGDEPGLSAEECLALREQIKAETEAERTRQGVLVLRDVP